MLAAVGPAIELVKAWLYVAHFGERWQEHLPLHLCNVNAFLYAAMLVLRSYRLFEITYFWSIGGSTIALFTPDILAGFPDPRYVLFFAGHATAVASVAFALVAFGFRPRFGSVGFAATVTACFALAVVPINLLLDTNYLYLCAKPAGASVFDYLGPWPWYLPPAVAIVLIVCYLCYLPFPIADRVRDERRADAPRGKSR